MGFWITQRSLTTRDWRETVRTLNIFDTSSLALAQIPGINLYDRWGIVLPATSMILLDPDEETTEVNRFHSWLQERKLGAKNILTVRGKPGQQWLLPAILEDPRTIEQIARLVHSNHELNLFMVNILGRTLVERRINALWNQTTHLDPRDAARFDTLRGIYDFLQRDVGNKMLPHPYEFASQRSKIIDAVRIVFEQVPTAVAEVVPVDLAGGGRRLFIGRENTQYSRTVNEYVDTFAGETTGEFLIRPSTMPEQTSEVSLHFDLSSRIGAHYAVARLLSAAGTHVGSMIFDDGLPEDVVPGHIWRRILRAAIEIREALEDLVPEGCLRGNLGINFTFEQHDGVLPDGKIQEWNRARSVIVSSVKVRQESESIGKGIADQLDWPDGYCVLQAGINLPASINSFDTLIHALGDLALKPGTREGVVARIPFPTDNAQFPYRTHAVALVKGGVNEATNSYEQIVATLGGTLAGR